MRRTGKTTLLLTIGVCVIAMLTVSPLYGEPRYDMHNDLVAYGALEFKGRIDQVSSGEADQQRGVIINDRSFDVAQDCILRNQFGKLVAFEYFKENMHVGYFVVDDTDITKMWHLEEEIEAESDQSSGQQDIAPSSSGDAGDEIRLEDGVWKN